MLSFTFFDSAEWTTDSVSKELYSKLEKERNELINEQIQDRGYIVKLENENKVLKARLKDAIGIDYTDSTDYIAQLHKNVLNQRKELRNLNKALERERKRNKELEELYSGAQKDVSMLNLKVMELNQGIRDSTDLTWKEKYDELYEYTRIDDSKVFAAIEEATTIDELIPILKVLQEDEDTELDHIIADAIVIKALKLLGQDELPDEYEKVDKWYS